MLIQQNVSWYVFIWQYVTFSVCVVCHVEALCQHIDMLYLYICLLREMIQKILEYSFIMFVLWEGVDVQGSHTYQATS